MPGNCDPCPGKIYAFMLSSFLFNRANIGVWQIEEASAMRIRNSSFGTFESL
jgi:hypothetical protein